MIFGIDVDGMQPGQAVAGGRLRRRLPHPEPARRAAGRVLRAGGTASLRNLPSLRRPHREAARWTAAKGSTGTSRPATSIRLRDKITSGRRTGPVAIALDQEIPPIPPPPDTKYIRHIRIQSALLTKFWGRPMYLGANVLVPEGFDEHPDAHFPVIISTTTLTPTSTAFAPSRPTPISSPTTASASTSPATTASSSRRPTSYTSSGSRPAFPALLVVEIQHANPYYDDSYAVNSANLGPYGDAIETELIPAIEKQFRGIGQGWARFVYGGSTGGWESLAVQMFYPDHYNGAFVACPDPVDFHAYTTDRPLQRPERLLHPGRAQAGGAARHARLSRPHPQHACKA